MDHRKRFLLALLVAVALVSTIIKRKLGPSWVVWQQERAWQDRSNEDPMGTARNLKLRLQALDSALGQAQDRGWQPVLDHMTGNAAVHGTRLTTVLPEHREQRGVVMLRTLPLTLEGRTEGILNTVAALEHANQGIRLVSVDLHARTPSYNAPRRLSATLYLRTIQP
jgi:hypothetical protein